MNILTSPIPTIRAAQAWAFDPFGESGGRIEVYEEWDGFPVVIGADFALGLENRDFDAAVAIRTDTQPMRQVAEAHGHWGPSFDRILYGMACYFGEAFILGERQVGLDRLRSLLQDFGYSRLYYDRREDTRARKITDKLGYWRGEGDVCIPNLRRAIRAGDVLFRSRALLDQLRRLQYAPQTSIDPDAALDKHLRIRLSGGGSPDLVMAAGYAYHAAGQVGYFDAPAPRFKPGSLGQILNHGDLYKSATNERIRRGRRRS